MKSLKPLPALRILGVLVLALAVPACRYDSPWVSLDWFVDPAFGDDFNGDGTSSFPFRTITRAMRLAISGDAVFLARGTYGASIGEIFPIRLKPGVIIQGDPATRGQGPVATLINGGGVYSISGGSQAATTVTAAFVMGSGSALSGVKISVAGATGVGVVFDGFPASLGSCTITACGASGIRVYQTGSPTISNNVISSNGASGVDVFDAAGPILRQNSILSNTTDGVVANDTSTPNLGDGVSAGANTLQANTGVGLNNNTTASTIQAVGNTWNVSKQGSDGSGNYAALLKGGPDAAVAGNNFATTNAAAAIQF
jgi:parallel beta-helix repeat protein